MGKSDLSVQVPLGDVLSALVLRVGTLEEFRKVHQQTAKAAQACSAENRERIEALEEHRHFYARQGKTVRETEKPVYRVTDGKPDDDPFAVGKWVYIDCPGHADNGRVGEIVGSFPGSVDLRWPGGLGLKWLKAQVLPLHNTPETCKLEPHRDTVTLGDDEWLVVGYHKPSDDYCANVWIYQHEHAWGCKYREVTRHDVRLKCRPQKGESQ